MSEPQHMIDYLKRMARARPAEAQIKDELIARGWLAYDFGQEQIPESSRWILRRYRDPQGRPALIRWLPDLLAIRNGPEAQTALIEVKAGSATPNCSIEITSLEVAEMFANTINVPVFFVCADADPVVFTASVVREHCHPGPPPAEGKGSGTPYLLVAKRHGWPFDRVFGSTIPAATAA